ncbi:hypothetical protein [Pseudomonas sp. CGJS7]|uniref:hypothetical protein n=1 Tax=Pseudomonas sp. CGJS7 TaxID=3109348 RepID=UPI00300A5C3C
MFLLAGGLVGPSADRGYAIRAIAAMAGRLRNSRENRIRIAFFAGQPIVTAKKYDAIGRRRIRLNACALKWRDSHTADSCRFASQGTRALRTTA